MTTSEHIDLIIKRRYNDYGGTMMQGLKKLHLRMRNAFGDEYFLRYLKEAERKIPQVPKYEIPQSARDSLNAL